MVGTRAKAKGESIRLIRGTPKTEVVWAKARWGHGRRLRRVRSVIVEMRDSALLAYPTSSPRTTSKEEMGKIIDATSPHSIEIVPMREARLKANSKRMTVQIYKSDLTGSIDIRFTDTESFESWKEQLTELTCLRSVTLADFDVNRHVGKGASGRVYLVKDKVTKENLALKVIEKTTVFESSDSYRHALDERIVLEMASNHPFILDMRFSFQNQERLFLVTEYCGGGDLFEYLNKRSKPMDEKKARFIIAEILLALEHIHKLGIVYRDLKLENVLLDEDGHVRIADFGLSKLLISHIPSVNSSPSKDGDAKENSPPQELPPLKRTKTFCGTREYVSPEMLSNDLYDTSVDLWAYGVLLYEILNGKTPFYSNDRDEIYDRIEKATVYYPKEMSDEVQDLLQGLLKRDVSKRLGTGPDGIAEIKAHPWFLSIDWDDIYNMKPNGQAMALELKKMHCGKPERVPKSAKRSKRQVAQDEAFRTLTVDCAYDVEAISKSSPRSPRRDSQPLPFAGDRNPRVVPMVKPKKRVPIIAGYSFIGKLPVERPKVEEVTGAKLQFHRNPSEGCQRENVFDHASQGTPGSELSPIELSPVSTVPDRTTVVGVKRITAGTTLSSRVSKVMEDDGRGEDRASLAGEPGDIGARKKVARGPSERRESAAVPRSTMSFSRPSSVLRKRHEERLFRRGKKDSA